jgi:hypothetical protein
MIPLYLKEELKMNENTIIIHPKELSVFKDMVFEGYSREIINSVELTEEEIREWILTRPELGNTEMVRTRPIRVTYIDSLI